MRVIAKTGLVYIPEWNGNKKETEQIKIHYRYLTGPEYDKFVGMTMPEYDTKGKQRGSFKFKIDKESMVRCGVEKIENLKVGETEITMVEQLCDMSELAGLYREFIEFYLEANMAPDKKKLK